MQHMLAASSLKRNPTLSSAKVEEENISKVETLTFYVGQRSKRTGSSSKQKGKKQFDYWRRYCKSVTFVTSHYLLGFSIE